MPINNSQIYTVISKTITAIDNDLYQLNGKGIFFAPELYIAFCVGKNIYKERKEIFGSELVEWERETKIKDYGIFDIGFKKNNNERELILELKIMGKGDDYRKDIKRLIELENVANRIFFVLVDTAEELGSDGRIETIKNELGLIPKFSQRISANPTWHPELKLKKYHCDLFIYVID